MTKGILWAALQEPIPITPIYPQGSPHHVTLFYDVDLADWKQWLGIEFEAKAIANVWNDDIQAINVEMPDHIPHKANPHITVSHRKGIAPAASNDLLASSDRNQEVLDFPVKIRIEFYEFAKPKIGRPKTGRGKTLYIPASKLDWVMDILKS